MGDSFGGLADLITDIMESLGYVGIAALVALENVFPPIPSELILPLAGFLAGQGQFWLPAVVAAATVGSVVGALVLYGLGAWLGEVRLRGVVRRYGKFVLLTENDLDRAIDWFDRRGATAVLVGRLMPVVRSLVSIPAGLNRMPIGRFVVYTAIGSTVWNGALVGLGWVLGDRWQDVNQYGKYLEYAVLALVAGVVVWFVWRRRSTKEPSDSTTRS